MKRKIIYIICFISLGTSIAAQETQRVSREMATVAAKNHMKNHLPGYSREGCLFSLSNENGDPILYEYSTDSMSLILSGNRSCLPILVRQKHTGSLLADTANLPEGLKFLINGYIEQINNCYVNRISSELREREWEELVTDTLSEPQRTIWLAGPFLTTRWGQNKSNDQFNYDLSAYNYFIGPDPNNTCEHRLVGCVGVAMAQVMNYWQYPVIRNDTMQFDWCNMADYLNYGGYHYDIYKRAIAYLMLSCAEAVNSNYGCTATYSNTSNIRDALVSFGYSTDAYYMQRSGNAADWKNKIKGCLDNGYPVVYGGGGHTFVCDGYTNDDKFHFEWGNVDFEPGECTLDNICPNGTNNFTNNQEAIFDIFPVNAQNICNVNLNLDDFYSNNLSLLQHYQPYEIVPQTMTKLSSASANSDSSWRTIPQWETAYYQAHKEVNLRDGFKAKAGCEFEAKVVPCEKCEERLGSNMHEKQSVSDRNNDGNNYSDNETSMAFDGHSTIIPELFPNPTDGELTMNVEGMVERVVVYNLQGQPVGGWRMLSVTEGNVKIDVQPLRSGTYLLCVRTTDGKVVTGRFVRK